MRLLLLVLLLSNMTLAAAEAGKEILLENDKVQLVRVSYPPGTESGMHSHVFPHRVVYVVQGGTVLLQPEDSGLAAKTLSLQSGDSLYLPAQTHNVKNIGNTDVILLETELKYE